MTPERVKAIAETAWIQPHYRPLDVAIERAIRQAVNEFAEEAAKQIDAQMKPFTMAGIIERAQALHIVRALKLPEE